MTGVKTTKTDPCVGGGRVLEALIWPCGFSKRQAFIQAVDGWWRFTARFKPAAATVRMCAFCKREGARECRRACVRSQDVSIVQMHVESSAFILYVVCVFRDILRELDSMFL